MFGTDSDEVRADDFEYGVDLFNAGYWWESHVCFERLWKEARRRDDREDALLLQGLIQAAAALVKRRLGNAGGEAKLRDKSVRRLDSLRSLAGGRARLRGVDVEALRGQVAGGEVPAVTLAP